MSWGWARVCIHRNRVAIGGMDEPEHHGNVDGLAARDRGPVSRSAKHAVIILAVHRIVLTSLPLRNAGEARLPFAGYFVAAGGTGRTRKRTASGLGTDKRATCAAGSCTVGMSVARPRAS